MIPLTADQIEEWTPPSLANVVPSHLADADLFDFAALAAQGGPRADGDIAFDDDDPHRVAAIADIES